MGTPESTECLVNNTIMHKVCDEIGLPTEPEKNEGPSTSLAFTGIEIDSVAMELRLPAEKLARMKAELASWKGRKACKKRDLLSLIGVLSRMSCSGSVGLHGSEGPRPGSILQI